MFLEHRAPYLAQELRRYPDIPRDLMLCHPLGDQRIFLKELYISFLRRFRDRGIKSLLEHSQRTLYQQPEHPFECGHLLKQQGLAPVIDGQHLAVFKRFDKQLGRLPLRKTADIAYPPVLYRKEQDGLHPFLVEIIGPDTSLDDKGLEIADLSLL